MVFNSTKREIMRLMSELGLEPSTDFEHDVMAEDAESFGMSDNRMKSLAALLRDVCCLRSSFFLLVYVRGNHVDKLC